jgi:hypothetical protein
MSQETPMAGQENELVEATEQVNRLLHELEGMVDSEQHAALTEFFAEWAVLSAMKATMEMQNVTTASDSSATTDEPGKGA